MTRALAALITFVCVCFVAVLGWFYLQEGTFEDAGARMDEQMETLDEDAARVANDVTDTLDEAAEDFDEDINGTDH